MSLRRLPGAKVITPVLWVLVLLGGGMGLFLALGRGLFPLVSQEKTTLSLLTSEAMAFLVTRRTAAQIVVEVQEGDWLGDWHGVLWATVRLHYGVDLRKVRPEDVQRRGEVIVVRIPQPELLDFTIEPGSVGYLAKSTAVPKVLDLLHNGHRAEMEKRLRQRAMEFAARQGMLPTREELVQELNGAADALGSLAKVKLQFE